MATAKTKSARMKQTAERLDWLMANARTLRSPALWERSRDSAFTILNLSGAP